MMNNTEELRAELDRLKIKWWEDDWDSSHRTVFDGANDVRYCAYEFCGSLYLMTRLPVTVEQAISATVGVGTCRCTVETSDDYYDDYTRYHMSCGFTMYGDGIEKPRFCGGCGKRIKEESE